MARVEVDGAEDPSAVEDHEPRTQASARARRCRPAVASHQRVSSLLSDMDPSLVGTQNQMLFPLTSIASPLWPVLLTMASRPTKLLHSHEDVDRN